MMPDVYILLPPQEEEVHSSGRAQIYTFSSTFIKKISIFVSHYIIMARSLLNWKSETKKQTMNLTVFMVLVIWASGTLKFLFLFGAN